MYQIHNSIIKGTSVVTPEFLEIMPGVEDQYPSEALIEYASRLCYNSNSKFGTNPNFIKGLIKAGHLDVLEHAALAIRFDLQWPISDSDNSLYKDLYELKTAFPYFNTYVDDIWSTGADVYLVGNLRTFLEYTWYEREFSNDLVTAISPHIKAALAAVAPNIFSNEDGDDKIFSYMKDEFERIIEVDRADRPSRLYGETKTDTGASVRPLGFMGIYAYELKFLRHSCYLVNDVSRAFLAQQTRHRLLSHCLAGDTIIQSFAQKKWTIKQLYEWSNDYKRSGRLKLIRLRGMDDKGEIVPVTIKNIVYSGKQQVYKLVTKSGRSVRATNLHRFNTPKGWKRLYELSVGDHVYSNGVAAYKNKEYIKQRYLIDNTERKTLAQEIGISDSTLGKWIRRFGLQKPKSQYPNRSGNPDGVKMTPEIRKRIGDSHRGNTKLWESDQDISESGGRIRARKMYNATECAECGSKTNLERHHIDKNPKNNSPENIIVLCVNHHNAWEAITKHLTFSDEIVSIELDEIVDTYDIEICENIHNFVANGIVVHNSVMSQRYVDYLKQGNDFVMPPDIDVDTKLDLQTHFDDVKILYEELRNRNIKKEDARAILPNASITHLVFSSFQKGINHYIKQRTATDAQYEIRKVAELVKAHDRLLPGGIY